METFGWLVATHPLAVFAALFGVFGGVAGFANMFLRVNAVSEFANGALFLCMGTIFSVYANLHEIRILGVVLLVGACVSVVLGMRALRR